MNVKLGLCLMAGMLILPAAHACDPLPGVTAFFWSSDINRDGVLDAAEWKQARIPANSEYTADFKVGSMAAFKRFDLDHNGVLTEEELPYVAFPYVADPCEDWLKAMNQIEKMKP